MELENIKSVQVHQEVINSFEGYCLYHKANGTNIKYNL